MSWSHRAVFVLPLFLILGACAARERTTTTTVRTQAVERPVAVEPSPVQTEPLREERARGRIPARFPPRRARGNMSLVSQTNRAANDRDITFEELRDHALDGTAVFIDAREPKEFRQGHLRGAFNIPADQKERYMEPVWKNVDRGQLVIVYCGGGTCHASEMVADYLNANGFTNVRVFKQGWQVLGSARVPRERGR